MADETVGGVAAPAVDNSPSLASVIGEMYGDYSDVEPEQDAGAPPAAAPETPAAGSEGTAPSEPAAAPAAPADGAASPDAAAPETETDPLEGSKPLDYTVNGESRTFEGVTVLKDGGAVVDPDALEHLQRVVGERDHYYETNQAQYQQLQQLEQLSTWIDRAPDGQTRTLQGPEGLVQMRVQGARMHAAFNTVAAVLRDPAKFAALIGGVDDKNNIVLNQREIQNLLTESDLAEMRAEQGVRNQLGALAQAQTARAPQAPDVAQLKQQVVPIIEAAAQVARFDPKVLTEDSRTFLAQQLPGYIRAVTHEDRRLNPSLQLGARIVDASFTQLVQREAASAAKLAQVATTTTTAASSNAAKLAAATVGKAGKQPPKIAPQKEPERTRADDFDDAWDRQQKAAAGALRAHSVVGGR